MKSQQSYSSEVLPIKIVTGNTVLRDYQVSDIEDDIRWSNTDTAWLAADTPWQMPEPFDPDNVRTDMLEMTANLQENTVRWRFEIEVSGRHIGFVSSYYPDRMLCHPGPDSVEPGKRHRVQALGIVICEQDYWGKASVPQPSLLSWTATGIGESTDSCRKPGAEMPGCLAAPESFVSPKAQEPMLRIP